MAIISQRGKAQDTTHAGGIRIEVQNDRIVYTIDGVVRRIDTALNTEWYSETGELIGVTGIFPDDL